MTVKRIDLVDAVLASRDEVAADFDADLLEAIVNAEAAAAGDADTAMRSIDAAVTAALDRGVGRIESDDIHADARDVDDEGEKDEG